MYSSLTKISLKSCLSVVFYIMFMSCSYTQDLLVKMQGDTIPIEVIEIQEKYLVYHKINIEDKRVFTTARNKLDRIIYSNGEEYIFKDESLSAKAENALETEELQSFIELYRAEFVTFNSGFFAPSIYQNTRKLSNVQVNQIYKDNPEALLLYRRGRTSNILGNIMGLPAGYIFGYQIGNAISDVRKVDQDWMLISGVGCLFSIILNVKGVSDIRKSTQKYNNSIGKIDDVSIGFQSTESGFGLVLSF